MKEEVEVLTKMKELLMEKGWCQGTLRNDQGNLCLLGTLDQVYLNNDLLTPYNRAAEAIRRQIESRSISNWNDAVGRTFNEVIDILDAAILAEKEKLV